MQTNKKHFVLNRMTISETILRIKIMNNLNYPLRVSKNNPLPFFKKISDVTENKCRKK